MILLKNTSTVRSLLTQKTLAGFHPVRGMVLERQLPLEEVTPADLRLGLLLNPASHQEWIPRPAYLDLERLMQMVAGQSYTIHGESLVSPRLLHWTSGEARMLIGLGSVYVPHRASARAVILLLGNQAAQPRMQQVAAALRPMIGSGSSRTTASLPMSYERDTLQLAYGRMGTFKTQCTLYLDADAEPSAERLQDYLELMHSVELNIDTPQEKLGWTKSLKKPGQVLLSLGQGLATYRFEPNETIPREIKTYVHLQSVERTNRLMNQLFGCKFDL